MKVFRRYSGFFAFCVAAGLALGCGPVSAFDKEQAIENCRASLGRPVFTACMQGGGNRESCMEKSRPLVQACVRNAMPKAALFSAEKPAVAAKPSAADVAKDAAASLVAPPRTISDISAILDQQKPDPAAIAKLTET